MFGFHKNINFYKGVADTSINGYTITYSTGNLLGRIQNLQFNGQGGDFCVSCYLKAQTTGTSVNVNLCDINASNIDSKNITLTTDYVKYIFIFKNITQYITTGNENGFLDIESTAGSKVFVKDIKIERGNKATPWSPAPEDGNCRG